MAIRLMILLHKRQDPPSGTPTTLFVATALTTASQNYAILGSNSTVNNVRGAGPQKIGSSGSLGATLITKADKGLSSVAIPI